MDGHWPHRTGVIPSGVDEGLIRQLDRSNEQVRKFYTGKIGPPKNFATRPAPSTHTWKLAQRRCAGCRQNELRTPGLRL